MCSAPGCTTEAKIRGMCKNHYNQWWRVQWREKNLSTAQMRRRQEHLKERYGITMEQYGLLLAKQGGGCAICGRTQTWVTKKGSLSVDHDHQTGKIRGLLCHPCNRALGFFREDPDLIQHALDYLRG